MRTFINWGRGRERELKTLLPLMPKDIDTLYIPYLGCGDVLLSTDAKAYVASDKCEELIELWRFVAKPQPWLMDVIRDVVDLWDLLPGMIKDFQDRLYEVYDGYVTGSIMNYFSMVSAVGRIVRGFCVPVEKLQGLKGWDMDEFRMELRHQWAVAIDLGKHLKMNNSDKFLKRITEAGLEAYFDYLVFLFNRPEAKGQTRAATMLWTMCCAAGHLFYKDRWGQYEPDFDVELADSLAFREQMQLMGSKFFTERMERTQLYKKDGVVMLSCEKPGKRDFIFADPPCLIGKRKKKGRLFSKSAQQDLADFLLNKTGARWMVILPKSDPIVETYMAQKLNSRLLCHEIVFWNY